MISKKFIKNFSFSKRVLHKKTTPQIKLLKFKKNFECERIPISPNQAAKNPRPAVLVRSEHLNGLNPLRVSDSEWLHRCETAAMVRSLFMYGFGDDLAAQCVISRNKDENGENFIYMHEWGVFFEEANASNLVKIDWNGNLVNTFTGKRTTGDASLCNMGCIPVATAIFDSQPDVNFIAHVHTSTIMAVASTECGLLPLSQAAMFLYNQIDRYPYNFSYDESFEAELAKSLIGKRGVLLDHHGCYTLGRTAAESFFVAFYLNQACETQIKAMSMNTKLKSVNSEDLEVQYKEMMLSPDYAYDGSREWAGLVRKLCREHADFNM